MLSLFMRSENQLPETPAHQPVADRNTALPSSKPAADPTNMAHNLISNGKADDLSGQLSVIIANAEFLEVLYGENNYLKNIINAADTAKHHLRSSI